MCAAIEVLRIPYPGFDLLLNRAEVVSGISFAASEPCPVAPPWMGRSIEMGERRCFLFSFDDCIRSLFQLPPQSGSRLGLLAAVTPAFKVVLKKKIQAAVGRGLPPGRYTVKHCILETGCDVVRQELSISEFRLLPQLIRSAMKSRGFLAVRYNGSQPQYLVGVEAFILNMIRADRLEAG